MTPFAALFERKTAGYITTPLGDLISDYWTRDVSGGVMRIAAAYACVRVVSETVASLPLFVHRRRPDGGKERAFDHPLYPVLHHAPTSRLTSFSWREMLQAHLCLRGNAYAHIHRDSQGRVTSLWPLHPDRVTVEERPDGDVAYRVQRTDGTPAVLGPRDVLHVMGLALDGLVGRSPVQDARYAFEVADATAQTAASLYKRGFRHALSIRHPKTLSEAAQQRLRDGVRAHYGPEGAEEPLVLEEDMKIEPISMTPDDAEFLETRKFTRSEIAGLFRVPLHLIGDLERSTNNNIEHQSLEFVIHCIRPWLVRWEQALTRALVGESDPDVFIEFNLDALLRGDANSRSTFYTRMFQVGALSTNNILELENHNPVGPDGDTRYVPGNLMKLGSVGTASGASAPEPAAEGQAA